MRAPRARASSQLPRALVMCALSLLPRMLYALDFVEPKALLESVGLRTDRASLLGYLREGLPAQLGNDPSLTSPTERFQLYNTVVDLLVDEECQEAHPLLTSLATQPWPETIERDFRLFALVNIGRETANWDEVRESVYLRRLDTRVHFAVTAAMLDGRKTVPALQALLLEASDAAKARAMIGGHTGSVEVSIRELGVRILSQGSPVAVPVLVDLLAVPEISQANLAQLLTAFTGEEFLQPGAHGDDAVDVAKWQGWWRQQGPDYALPRQDVEVSPSQMAMPEAGTLEARLLSARTGYGEGVSDAAWLEAHADEYVNVLRRIVDDSSQLDPVREEALRWYAKVGRRAARELLVKLALKRAKDMDRSLTCWYGGALRLLDEESPKKAEEIARRCLPTATPMASDAIRILARTEEGREYILEHYEEIVGRAPFARVDIALVMTDASEPRAAEVLLAALDDRATYGYGTRMQMAAALERMELPSDVEQEAAARTRAFREDPVEQIEGMLDGYVSPDVDHVQVFDRAIEQVGRDSVDALHVAVRAYAVSRREQDALYRKALSFIEQRAMALDLSGPLVVKEEVRP